MRKRWHGFGFLRNGYDSGSEEAAALMRDGHDFACPLEEDPALWEERGIFMAYNVHSASARLQSDFLPFMLRLVSLPREFG